MVAASATRRRRSDGERSRRAILLTATRLATVEGLEGLSIARLAEASGISKSGLYAHFGSKEELQLATIETAGEIFGEEVVGPSAAAAAGRERLLALADAFLTHLERGVFPGGCFFASTAAEFDTRPGRVRDEVVRFQRGWMGMLERHATEAGAEDPQQLAFELNAMLIGANSGYLLTADSRVLERARRGVARLLA